MGTGFPLCEEEWKNHIAMRTCLCVSWLTISYILFLVGIKTNKNINIGMHEEASSCNAICSASYSAERSRSAHFEQSHPTTYSAGQFFHCGGKAHLVCDLPTGVQRQATCCVSTIGGNSSPLGIFWANSSHRNPHLSLFIRRD